MRSTLSNRELGTVPPTVSTGDLLPIVSMLRRGGRAAPGRRPPLGRRLRDTPADTMIPAESRIVFRAGSLALR